MVVVYKNARNVGKKPFVSYHLRGQHSIPFLSSTSCFLWGAQANAFTSQNGFTQHPMCSRDNTASKTMLLSSVFSFFYSKPLTTRNAILAAYGCVDVSSVQTHAKSYRHLFGNWTTSLTHVSDLSSTMIGCMLPSVSINHFLCLPGLKKHHSSLLMEEGFFCSWFDWHDM